jgi:hypothetical protein
MIRVVSLTRCIRVIRIIRIIRIIMIRRVFYIMVWGTTVVMGLRYGGLVCDSVYVAVI